MLSTSMDLKNLNRHSLISIRNPNFKQLHSRSASFNQSHVHFSWCHRHCKPPIVSRLQIFQSASNNRHKRLITACISRSKEILGEDSEISGENSDNLASVSSIEEEEEEETEVVETEREEFAPKDSIWNQIVEIMKFSGPAIGLWICGPLMSLIDTVVIGQGSSLELAALGPATVLCDYLSYVFMFLSIATSNMVATSLAKQVGVASFLEKCLSHPQAGSQLRVVMQASHLSGCLGCLATTLDELGMQANVLRMYELFVHGTADGLSDIASSALLLHTCIDKDEVQHQISILLFVGLTCGVAMLFFTRLLGAWALTGLIVHISDLGNRTSSIQTVYTLYLKKAWIMDSKKPGVVCKLVISHMLFADDTILCREGDEEQLFTSRIRGLAWPAVLVGWVAQSASLGMKDSWGPLKALAVASAVNGIGDIVLCTFLGYGIAGAAWATMVSQVIAGYMMIEALNNKGYNAYAISVPSPSELMEIFMLAAPVFVTMMSKVAFYALIVYFATSMGTHTVAAHQARALLKSLLIIGALSGLTLGSTGAFVPLVFPKMFSPDPLVITEGLPGYSTSGHQSVRSHPIGLEGTFRIAYEPGMTAEGDSLAESRDAMRHQWVPWLSQSGHKRGYVNYMALATSHLTKLRRGMLFGDAIMVMRRVLIPFFFALCITSCVHSLEGTLLAGRDLKFISLSMCGCFSLAALFLMLVSSRGYGLPGCWCALIVFQWSRFFMALRRLLSPDGILYSEDLTPHRMEKLRAA
ncbi:MATE efflux family protein [Actinidia rufa]|uniref:MATE efflux family protein n=1 Tax=Actinidia rufa TaxID=165716 RepID=A0A7J0F752_9ERIC|nr:MATE efflux family protein [Actinidia rufa]